MDPKRRTSEEPEEPGSWGALPQVVVHQVEPEPWEGGVGVLGQTGSRENRNITNIYIVDYHLEL